MEQKEGWLGILCSPCSLRAGLLSDPISKPQFPYCGWQWQLPCCRGGRFLLFFFQIMFMFPTSLRVEILFPVYR